MKWNLLLRMIIIIIIIIGGTIIIIIFRGPIPPVPEPDPGPDWGILKFLGGALVALGGLALYGLGRFREEVIHDNKLQNK
jgi:hypothetical protein